MTVSPAQPMALSRSFVARKLVALGAEFDGGAAQDVFGGTSDGLRQLGLVDLSPLPRTGFKGPGTIAAMQAAGIAVAPEPNRAFRQSDGGLCAVLAPGEVILLAGLGGDPALVDRLEASWSMDDPHGTYLMPRRSSHAWFRIAGELAPAMFAKICGIDLRPTRFADLAIAQTSIARLNGIIIRDDIAATLAFHLLADSASAEYLWDCVIDAMTEFGAAPAGLAALRNLASPP